MSSELAPVAGDSGVEQRLHPLSWLFTMVVQLKQFALPLILLLVTGRRNDSDLYGLIGVGVLMAISIAQYFTYRYRIDVDGVVIRSGLLQRSLRHIPFSRIQNVTLHQNLLHRLFDVAEVRLESAGAAKPEGQMRVLRIDAAHELERQVRGSAARAKSVPDAAPASEDLLQMSTGEVVKLGLINNRGTLVIGGLFALLAQAGDNLIGKLFSAVGRWLSGQASALHLSLLAMVVAGLLLFVLMIVLLRVLSVVLALLQFHGFRLSESEGRLSIERGLLTRVRGSVPRHRIQAFSLCEGLLHRWFGRRSLRVDTAVIEAFNERRSMRDLVPLATPAVMEDILQRLLPTGAWPIEEWKPLHPRAWRRKFMLPFTILLAVTAVLSWFRGPWLFTALLLAPVLYWRSRLWAQRSAYSVANGLVAFRGGWLDRRWRFAEARKLQGIEWRQSPFDRRNGMATLRFDTAGAGTEWPLEIPYLPEGEARRLYSQLSAGLAAEDAGTVIRSRTVESAEPAP